MRLRLKLTLTGLLWSIFCLQPVKAITYEDLCQFAITHSWDVKMADVDTHIAKTRITYTRSDYYPSVQLRMNNEYLKDLDPRTARPVTTVGTTIIPAGTRYQNAINLTAQLTLWDFGVRRNKLDAARNDVSAKDLQTLLTQKALKLKLLDYYTDALSTQQQLNDLQRISNTHQQLFDTAQRLYEAGLYSQVQLGEVAIDFARHNEHIQQAKQKLLSLLNELRYWSQYPLSEQESLEVLSRQGNPLILNEGTSVEAMQADRQITQKEHELTAQKRQGLPTLAAYTYYNIYGVNHNNLPSAYDNLRQRSLQVGLSLSYMAFDGLKNRSEIQRLQLELEHLKLEKQKKLADLRHQFEQAALQQKGRQVESQQLTLTETDIDLQSQLVDRLSARRLVDKLSVYRQTLKKQMQLLEIRKLDVQQQAARQKQWILVNG